MPFPALIIKPRYLVVFTLNSHFLISTYSPASQSLLRTFCIQSQCYYKLLSMQINTSSRQAKQNSSRYSLKVQLIYCQKVLREFAILKEVTSYLKRLKRVQKAIFYLSPLVIQILQKAIITSSLVNYLALLKLLSVSQISSNRYLSFLIIALSAQQLIYNQRPPPSFFANRTSKDTSKLLTRINPFLRSDVSFFWSSNSSPLDMLYRGPYGG